MTLLAESSLTVRISDLRWKREVQEMQEIFKALIEAEVGVTMEEAKERLIKRLKHIQVPILMVGVLHRRIS